MPKQKPVVATPNIITLLSLRFPFGKLSFRIEVEGDPELVKSALQRAQRKESPQ